MEKNQKRSGNMKPIPETQSQESTDRRRWYPRSNRREEGGSYNSTADPRYANQPRGQYNRGETSQPYRNWVPRGGRKSYVARQEKTEPAGADIPNATVNSTADPRYANQPRGQYNRGETSQPYRNWVPRGGRKCYVARQEKTEPAGADVPRATVNSTADPRYANQPRGQYNRGETSQPYRNWVPRGGRKFYVARQEKTEPAGADIPIATVNSTATSRAPRNWRSGGKKGGNHPLDLKADGEVSRAPKNWSKNYKGGGNRGRTVVPVETQSDKANSQAAKPSHEKEKPKFVPAPPPKENIWEVRMQKALEEKAQRAVNAVTNVPQDWWKPPPTEVHSYGPPKEQRPPRRLPRRATAHSSPTEIKEETENNQMCESPNFQTPPAAEAPKPELIEVYPSEPPKEQRPSRRLPRRAGHHKTTIEEGCQTPTVRTPEATEDGKISQAPKKWRKNYKRGGNRPRAVVPEETTPNKASSQAAQAEKEKPKFVPAPPPKENIWEIKKQKALEEKAQRAVNAVVSTPEVTQETPKDEPQTPSICPTEDKQGAGNTPTDEGAKVSAETHTPKKKNRNRCKKQTLRLQLHLIQLRHHGTGPTNCEEPARLTPSSSDQEDTEPTVRFYADPPEGPDDDCEIYYRGLD